MTYWVGYHKLEDRPFSRKEFFTSSTRRPVAGDALFVVLGHGGSPAIYSLAGEYRIADRHDGHFLMGDRVFQTKLYLEAIASPPDPIRLDESVGINPSDVGRAYAGGRGMQKAEEPFLGTFKRLLSRLADNSQKEEAEDVAEILADPTLDSTTRMRMVESRLGQGKFRREVEETWDLGEQCALTGIRVREVLTASHIIPWRESEALRLDGTNGILLCAHLDRLFDRYLVSFDDSGRLIGSRRLSSEQWKALHDVGIRRGAELQTHRMNLTTWNTIAGRLRKHRQRMDKLDSPEK